MKLKVINISDIHIDERLHIFNELREVFLKKVLEAEPDLIVINGDLFEKKLDFSSKEVTLTLEFFSDLAKVVKEKNMVLVLNKGTLTHDYNQMESLYEALKPLLSDQLYYFDKVGELEIDEDNSILFIPEEYPEDQLDYYSNTLYSGKKYLVIFFHGTVTSKSFSKDEAENTPSKSVIFEDSDLRKATKTFAIGGHIHSYSTDGVIVYSSSFSRRTFFAAEEEKGFLEIELNLEDLKNSKVERVINTLAPKYKTVRFKDFSEENDVQTKVSKVEKILNEFDFLRILYSEEERSNEAEFNSFVSILIKEFGVKRIKFQPVSSQSKKVTYKLNDESESIDPNIIQSSEDEQQLSQLAQTNVALAIKYFFDISPNGINIEEQKIQEWIND